MPELVFEIGNSGDWVQIGPPLRPGDPAGSVSHNPGGSREVFMFDCSSDGGVLARSLGGVDIEHGLVRELRTSGFEAVAMIRPGEEYEFELQTDRMNAPIPARLRCR